MQYAILVNPRTWLCLELLAWLDHVSCSSRSLEESYWCIFFIHILSIHPPTSNTTLNLSLSLLGHGLGCPGRTIAVTDLWEYGNERDRERESAKMKTPPIYFNYQPQPHTATLSVSRSYKNQQQPLALICSIQAGIVTDLFLSALKQERYRFYIFLCHAYLTSWFCLKSPRFWSWHCIFPYLCRLPPVPLDFAWIQTIYYKD